MLCVQVLFRSILGLFYYYTPRSPVPHLPCVQVSFTSILGLFCYFLFCRVVGPGAHPKLSLIMDKKLNPNKDKKLNPNKDHDLNPDNYNLFARSRALSLSLRIFATEASSSEKKHKRSIIHY